MNTLLQNVRWTALAQVSRIAGQVLSMLILSRLLPPADYGVMAMAGVVTALISMLRDMGTGAAIIQRKSLSDELTNTVFWLNLGLSVTLGLTLALTSGPLGAFFGEPRLPSVLMLLALLFPLGGVSAVHQALVERRSDFRSLAILDMVSQLAGLVLAVAAALAGWGVFSLVVPAAFAAILSSVWLWRLSGWRPRWVFSREEFSSLWSFSGHLTAFNFVNYFARNADSMIIGRILGSVALGNYAMAYKLMLFPVQNLSWVVNLVTLPKFSRLQDDRPGLRAFYFEILSAVLSLSAPVLVGLWVLRDLFVHVAFGEYWSSLPGLLFWLAPVGLMQSAVSTIGGVFTAMGKTGQLFIVGVVSTVMCAVSFWLGAQNGTEGVAFAYFLANIINTIWCFAAVLRLIGAGWIEAWRSVWVPLAAASLMAAALHVLMWASASFSDFVLARFLSLVVMGIMVYLGALVFVFKKPPLAIIRFVRGN